MDFREYKLANLGTIGAMLGGAAVGGTLGTAATLTTKGIKPKIIGAAVGTLAGAGIGAGGKPRVPTYQQESE